MNRIRTLGLALTIGAAAVAMGCDKNSSTSTETNGAKTGDAAGTRIPATPGGGGNPTLNTTGGTPGAMSVNPEGAEAATGGGTNTGSSANAPAHGNGPTSVPVGAGGSMGATGTPGGAGATTRPGQ